ncbi:MAG TPA: DUF4124 domain-containing protein [Gallionella sp.]|nr:DUF4124 domain-containing protein [Gallionella sp.]
MKKVLLLLFTLLSASALAAINKWVDEHGQVHYSDQPPPANVKAQKVVPALGPEATQPAKTTGTPAASAPATTTTAASAPAATKTAAERDAELKKAKQAKEEAAKKAAQEQAIADTYKANCENAQRNLRALQSGMRIAEIDANGQRYYLSDQERKQRIDKTQQDIATYCK